MKNLIYVLLSFSVLLLAGINQKADAQVPSVLVSTVKATKASLISIDTAYAPLKLDASYTSVEAVATKTGGVVAGKIYLQGKTLDGSLYLSIDSVSVTNSAGLQYKLFTVPALLIYSDYRLQFLSTGGNWIPSVYTLRRF